MHIIFCKSFGKYTKTFKWFAISLDDIRYNGNNRRKRQNSFCIYRIHIHIHMDFIQFIASLLAFTMCTHLYCVHLFLCLYVCMCACVCVCLSHTSTHIWRFAVIQLRQQNKYPAATALHQVAAQPNQQQLEKICASYSWTDGLIGVFCPPFIDVCSSKRRAEKSQLSK